MEKTKVKMVKQHLILLAFIILSACKPEIEPIIYGRDNCTYCKMTILDNRFAAEILSKKGRTNKFDDIECVLKYIKGKNIKKPDVMIFVANFRNPLRPFLDSYKAIYIYNPIFNTPMNGNYAAFPGENEKFLKDSLKKGLLGWSELKTN